MLSNRFLDMKWNERNKSLKSYTQRLRMADLALPGGVPEDVLRDRRRAGVHARLDVFLSRLSHLSPAAQSREQVKSVAERPGYSSGVFASGEFNRFAYVTCHYCGEKDPISRNCPKRNENRKIRSKTVDGSQSISFRTAPGTDPNRGWSTTPPS